MRRRVFVPSPDSLVRINVSRFDLFMPRLRNETKMKRVLKSLRDRREKVAMRCIHAVHMGHFETAIVANDEFYLLTAEMVEAGHDPVVNSAECQSFFRLQTIAGILGACARTMAEKGEQPARIHVEEILAAQDIDEGGRASIRQACEELFCRGRA
jgi:hypothetical protein